MQGFFEHFDNIQKIRRYGILKGYKNGLYGEAIILMREEITKDYTLNDFQNDRLCIIEDFKNDFTNFVTEVR